MRALIAFGAVVLAATGGWQLGSGTRRVIPGVGAAHYPAAQRPQVDPPSILRDLRRALAAIDRATDQHDARALQALEEPPLLTVDTVGTADRHSYPVEKAATGPGRMSGYRLEVPSAAAAVRGWVVLWEYRTGGRMSGRLILGHQHADGWRIAFAAEIPRSVSPPVPQHDAVGAPRMATPAMTRTTPAPGEVPREVVRRLDATLGEGAPTSTPIRDSADITGDYRFVWNGEPPAAVSYSFAVHGWPPPLVLELADGTQLLCAAIVGSIRLYPFPGIQLWWIGGVLGALTHQKHTSVELGGEMISMVAMAVPPRAGKASPIRTIALTSGVVAAWSR